LVNKAIATVVQSGNRHRRARGVGIRIVELRVPWFARDLSLSVSVVLADDDSVRSPGMQCRIGELRSMPMAIDGLTM
jgi:hypothetical protein